MVLNAEEADHDARHSSCLLKLRGGDYDGRPLFLAMEINMFSVCTMIYGDYPLLAKKLLESLKYPVHVSDFRIGLNEVSDQVRSYVMQWAANTSAQIPVYVFQEKDNKNVGKYPLMRQMFRHTTLDKKVMWFDDDSYLDETITHQWWDSIRDLSKTAEQIGAIHQIMQRNKQFEVIAKQPWYGKKPLNHRTKYRFATGGWWVADSKFLLKYDYPFKALYHNGGDSILGEVIRQQGLRLKDFKNGMQCHCESCMRRGIKTGVPVVHINVGGRQGRRGIGVANEKYVWNDGNPNPDLSHQDFEMKVTSYGI